MPAATSKGVTKGVGDTVKNAPKTVQDAPKAVQEVTKTLPKPQVTVPKEVKTPGGGSVNTGEAGKTGPSVTLPKTQLPVPSLPPVAAAAAPAERPHVRARALAACGAAIDTLRSDGGA